MPAPVHSHHERGASSGSFWTSRALLVCVAFLLIGGILLWTEHLAHALGFLPYLLILACPLMHLFMHGGHGGHQHQQRTDGDRSASDGGRS